jgi:Protein of unknown function (DUF3014)
MQADNEERYIEDSRTGGLPLLPLLLAIGVLAAALGWYFAGPNEDTAESPAADITPVVPAKPPAPAEPEEAPAPDIPEPVAAAPSSGIEPNQGILPAEPELTLEQSDPPVREQLTPLLGDTVLSYSLANDQLIDRAAALIDASSKGRAFHQVLKLPAPEGAFAVVTQGEAVYASPQNYQRFDNYARAIDAVDPALLAQSFHTFRPLLEQAYAALGYEADQLDNSLIRALDKVIAAPVLQGPALLEKDVTTWLYADESLESLSPLAKQLLRMGPENQAVVQAKARALRQALLEPPKP